MRLRALLGVLVVGLMVGTLLPRGEAANLNAHGWWWRPQTGLVGVKAPPPPTVPEGGLYVSAAAGENDVEGSATAIAALRFALDTDETNPILTLDVAGETAGDPSVTACPAGSHWLPEEAGPWDRKPTVACDLGSVSGIASDDGSTWAFPVAGLVDVFIEGTLDVVLVPGSVPTPGGRVVTPFEIAFRRPTSGSLETTSTGSDSSDPQAFEPPPPAAFEPPDPSSGGSFAPAPPPVAQAPFAPALEDTEQGVTETSPLGPDVARPATELPDPGGRIPAAILILLAAGLWWWTAQQPVRQPQKLGPMRARGPVEPPGEVRGLGRFARPRSGAPPEL